VSRVVVKAAALFRVVRILTVMNPMLKRQCLTAPASARVLFRYAQTVMHNPMVEKRPCLTDPASVRGPLRCFPNPAGAI
jgi:hypothetical protein